MGQPTLVRAGDTEFFVEVAEGSGPQTVGIADALSFDGVRATVEAIGDQLAAAWDRVRPDEATVEFGLNLTAKTGKLTGMLIEGGGDAALRITLTWKGGNRP